MNVYLGVVVTSLLVGMGCAFVAYQTKRDPLLWFVLGVGGNVIAILLLAVLNGRNRGRANARHS